MDNFFHLISVLVVLSALFAYFNFRVLKLPAAIGLMAVSLVFSILVIFSGHFFPALELRVDQIISSINFSELLLEIMLSFMLFAGAIHIRYDDLKQERLSIILFATVSVLISTVLIGFAAWYILGLFGFNVSLIHALLFGALISPTDPIAVLSILKSAGISRSRETIIAGESLFNDGVAVVVFLTILSLSAPGSDLGIGAVVKLFAVEAIGGILLGLLAGYFGYKLMASIDNYQVEVLITLAIVMGGYTLAHFIHVSGPLAMVAAGILTGNTGKSYAMSERTAEYIDKFWELIDEMLNALLFVLIGLELLIIRINGTLVLIGVILIAVALLSRYVSLLIPAFFIRLRDKITQKTLILLTWGGLRGGISIALALSVPPAYQRDIWVTLAYCIVCFSILVQGLSVGKVSKGLKE